MACWRFMACWCGVSGIKAYDWLIAFWSESSSPRESSCNQSAVARLLGTPPRALATDFEGAASCPPRLAGAYRETPPWFVINAVGAASHERKRALARSVSSKSRGWHPKQQEPTGRRTEVQRGGRSLLRRRVAAYPPHNCGNPP